MSVRFNRGELTTTGRGDVPTCRYLLVEPPSASH